MEDIPLGRGDGGHRRHGERAEQEAAGGGEEDDEGDGVDGGGIYANSDENAQHILS